MNYGLYLSAAGVLSGIHRLDVAANNLANVNTTAFKSDFATLMQRDTAKVEGGLFAIPSNRLLEQLGGGVFVAPTRTSFAPAATQETNNPLDVAILGDGFFSVDSGNGSGDDRIRFTRDGRFAIDADGNLVTATNGMHVLDDSGNTISLDSAKPVTISPSGDVRQDGQSVAQIGVTKIADTNVLRKAGANLYQVEPGRSAGRTPSEAHLRAGSLEASGVDPIKAMMAVTDASRDIQNNTKMVEMQDELLGRAISTFGRIG